MRVPAGTFVRAGAMFLVIGLAGPVVPGMARAGGAGVSADSAASRSAPTLEALLARAREARWDTLAIGERVARFGLAFEGAPYVDGTLEGPGPEVCRVTTGGFDCVTFMELCLDLARVTGRTGGATAAPSMREDTEPITIEDRKVPRLVCGGVIDVRPATPDDVRAAVTYTRYRGGRLTDYTSRLHYTSEWIADNVAKHVIDDVTEWLGGSSCRSRVDYMSTHPDAYPALVAHPEYVEAMRWIEQRVSRLARVCIPRRAVATVEPQFHTGDLVAIVTSVPGLDYAHTGIIVRDQDGVPRFMHASSKHGRVILDGRLSDYLAGAPKSFIGVTILRPRGVAGTP